MSIAKPDTYIEQQMLKAAPLPVLGGANGQIKIKITSENGSATKWLNLTPQQFKMIERVLFGEEIQ